MSTISMKTKNMQVNDNNINNRPCNPIGNLRSEYGLLANGPKNVANLYTFQSIKKVTKKTTIISEL